MEKCWKLVLCCYSVKKKRRKVFPFDFPQTRTENANLINCYNFQWTKYSKFSKHGLFRQKIHKSRSEVDEKELVLTHPTIVSSVGSSKMNGIQVDWPCVSLVSFELDSRWINSDLNRLVLTWTRWGGLGTCSECVNKLIWFVNARHLIDFPSFFLLLSYLEHCCRTRVDTARRLRPVNGQKRVLILVRLTGQLHGQNLPLGGRTDRQWEGQHGNESGKSWRTLREMWCERWRRLQWLSQRLWWRLCWQVSSL